MTSRGLERLRDLHEATQPASTRAATGTKMLFGSCRSPSSCRDCQRKGGARQSGLPPWEWLQVYSLENDNRKVRKPQLGEEWRDVFTRVWDSCCPRYQTTTKGSTASFLSKTNRIQTRKLTERAQPLSQQTKATKSGLSHTPQFRQEQSSL